MKKVVILPLSCCLMLLYLACNDAPSKEKQSILTGAASILVDEGILPIIESQLEVFKHSYVHTDIALLAKPENEVISALIRDTGQVAVLTRLLTAEENEFFEKRKFRPRITPIAKDAIAIIAHTSVANSRISVAEIQSIMRGEQLSGNRSLIFDHANSSTVRYFKELAGVDSLPANGVYALRSNRDVIRYVHEHPGTFGVVGINWIIQPDSADRQFVDGLRVLAVSSSNDTADETSYYEPTQSNLAEGLYPLWRPIYIVNCEPRRGLGMGFAAFVSGDRGQRIILKSGLMPDSLPPREIMLRSR